MSLPCTCLNPQTKGENPPPASGLGGKVLMLWLVSRIDRDTVPLPTTDMLPCDVRKPLTKMFWKPKPEEAGTVSRRVSSQLAVALALTWAEFPVLPSALPVMLRRIVPMSAVASARILAIASPESAKRMSVWMSVVGSPERPSRMRVGDVTVFCRTLKPVLSFDAGFGRLGVHCHTGEDKWDN